jgi:hypothetical protein
MSEQSLQNLLLALGMAAFERAPDGSFTSLGPVPPWLRRVAADGTFPFLGHILDEVHAFFSTGIVGMREFGPCSDVDENEQPFHYVVMAASLDDRRFLVLRRDPGSDRVQEVLQKAREQALDIRAEKGAADALSILQGEVHWQRESVRELGRRLLGMDLPGEQSHLVHALVREVESLVDRVDDAARRVTRPGS